MHEALTLQPSSDSVVDSSIHDANTIVAPDAAPHEGYNDSPASPLGLDFFMENNSIGAPLSGSSSFNIAFDPSASVASFGGIDMNLFNDIYGFQPSQGVSYPTGTSGYNAALASPYAISFPSDIELPAGRGDTAPSTPMSSAFNLSMILVTGQ